MISGTASNKESSRAVLLVCLVLLGVTSFYRAKLTSDSLSQQPFSSHAAALRTLEQASEGGINGDRELIFGEDKVRVAAFGSSNTWGAALEDRYQSYPYLVSQTADNYALFAGGPNYPSVCLQSLIGDDKVYDVILLEYWLRSREGLAELAGRLRRRFPHAIIIFIKLWGPFHARRKPSDTSEEPAITFDQWRSTVHTEHGQTNELIKLLKQDTGHWFFPDHQEADVLVNKAARDVGGYQLHMPFSDTAQESLQHYLRFFDRDYHTHLNEVGHTLIANLTRAIMHEHAANQDEGEQVNSAGRMGEWGLGDSCHLWMTTGACNLEYSEQFQMSEYDENTGKFALEMPSAGWVDVHNPFDSPRQLYLSFIATNTPGKYPVMEVKFVGVDGQEVVHYLHPANAPDNHQVGVIRTAGVGAIPVGPKTRLLFTPQSGGELPFRLVGTSFSNDIAVPLEYNFGPMFNI